MDPAARQEGRVATPGAGGSAQKDKLPEQSDARTVQSLDHRLARTNRLVSRHEIGRLVSSR